MTYERQIPGGPYIDETATAQRQIPGGPFVDEVAVIPSIVAARPASDVTTGAWSPNFGASLFAVIDEVFAQDFNFITTTSVSVSEVLLSEVPDPLSSSNHTINFRSRGQGTLVVDLLQGAVVISSYTPTLLPTFNSYSWTLTGPEADSITDYSDLRLRFTAS
jgi:hypothetical protein